MFSILLKKIIYLFSLLFLGIDLYRVYRTSAPSDIVAELRQKLSEDVERTNLASYELHCIASALKKYLRELPNPVFPVQFYDKFIETASKYILKSVFF